MDQVATTQPAAGIVGHQFEDVCEDALRWFAERVERLNRVASKIGNGGFTIKTVETSPAMDRAKAARLTASYFANRPSANPGDHGPYTGAHHTVTVTGTLPQIEGGWQILAAIDHEATTEADGYRNIVRSYEDGIVAEWLTASPNCDHCNADRNRRSTVVVRDADGNIRQVGKSCLRDFVGHQDIDTLMSLATCWGDFVSEGDEEGGSPSSAANFVAAGRVVVLALAATKAFGYHKSGTDQPTRSTVDILLGGRNRTNAHIFDAVKEAIQALGGAEVVANDAAAAIEWVATQDGNSDYMTNMATVFAATPVDRKHLGFAVSLAPVWNREQQRMVERSARAEVEATRKVDAEDAPEGRVQVEGVVVATKTYENAYGTTEKMTVLADAGFKVFVSIPAQIAGRWVMSAEGPHVGSEDHAQPGEDAPDQYEFDGSEWFAPAGRGDRVRFTATLERSNDDSTFAFGKRPAKADIVERAEPTTKEG